MTARLCVRADASHVVAERPPTDGHRAGPVLGGGAAERATGTERRQGRAKVAGSRAGGVEGASNATLRRGCWRHGHRDHQRLAEDTRAESTRRQTRQSPRLVPQELDEAQVTAAIRRNIRHSQVRGGFAMKR